MFGMHRRGSGSSGPRATLARLTSNLLLPGSPSGSLSQLRKTTPPSATAFAPPCVSKPVGSAAVRSHAPEPDSPLLGGEWGWERPPSDPTIYSPGVRTYARTYFPGSGSLPARACGAISPCGKATNPPARPVEAGGRVEGAIHSLGEREARLEEGLSVPRAVGFRGGCSSSHVEAARWLNPLSA